MTHHISLANLGWQPFFQQQLTLEEYEQFLPARIIEQHKSQLVTTSELGQQTIPINHNLPAMTVGDWILLTPAGRITRLLDRISCFRRVAAGSRKQEQLIAANVDTAFIVCSLNEDFNLNRIERYLSIVHDAGAEPVVVLSKMDLCTGPENMRQLVQQLDTQLQIELVNCNDRQSTEVLTPWCQKGKTIAMLGSSGAGKSTLSNTLLGQQIQATATIRSDDDKGRHTTTSRSLLLMQDGGMVLDTPGMREIQLGDCELGVAATFSDIQSLSENCRFSDCKHENEPGCAVQNAVKNGQLDQRRLTNYNKLLREQALNGASLAQRRANDRELGRFYRRVQRDTNKIKSR